jgi:C-terminal processing protease CtpA/Prc
MQSGGLLVANLVPGGPAAASGQVSKGDELLAVDGQPVAGKSIPDVIRMILGPTNTLVCVCLWRERERERERER